jgi:hypothetical protein
MDYLNSPRYVLYSSVKSDDNLFFSLLFTLWASRRLPYAALLRARSSILRLDFGRAQSRPALKCLAYGSLRLVQNSGITQFYSSVTSRSFAGIWLLSTYMAKSGQSNAHNPQSAHWELSVISGGWYPLGLVRFDITNTPRGQNSTQNPQPLQRSSIIWMMPQGTWMRSLSKGCRQYFTISPYIQIEFSQRLLIACNCHIWQDACRSYGKWSARQNVFIPRLGAKVISLYGRIRFRQQM